MYRRLVSIRIKNKSQVAFLYFLNYLVTSIMLGSMTWASFRVIMHSISYLEALKVGFIFGGIELLYDVTSRFKKAGEL